MLLAIIVLQTAPVCILKGYVTYFEQIFWHMPLPAFVTRFKQHPSETLVYHLKLGFDHLLHHLHGLLPPAQLGVILLCPPGTRNNNSWPQRLAPSPEQSIC